MAVSVYHALTATTPDDPAYEIRPSHYNSVHVASQYFTILGNTSGQSTVSGTNVVLSAGPNATISVNGSTLVFSGGAGAAGNTGYLSDGAGVTASLGTIRLSDANGIGWGLNGQTLTASHNALTTAALSNHSHGDPTLALTNLTGTTASASNGLTLSLSAAAPQTGISGVIASDATYTSGTVSFSNQNGVTIGSSVNGATQYVRLSVATSYAASNHSHGNPTLNLTNLSGTTASNSAGLTLSLSANAPGAATLTISAVGNTTVNSSGTWANALSLRAYGVLSAGTSNGSLLLSTPDPVDFTALSVGNSSLGNTAGDTGVFTGQVVFVGSNNITLSNSSNGGSATISIIGAAGGAGYSAGVSNVGNTSGNTGITGSNLVFSGGNRITLSQSTHANGATIGISGPNAQTGISGVIVSDATYTSGTVSFSGQNNITIGSSVNGASQYIRLSVGNYITTARASTDAIGLNTAQTNVTWTVNSSGISFNAGGYAGTGTSATNASITLNTNGLAISVAAPGAAAEANAINLLGANTAGNTTATGSTIGWSGINATLSGTNDSQVVISVPATSSLVGSSGITVSTNGSTISVMQRSIVGWEPYRDQEVVSGQQGQGTMHFNPHVVEAPRVWDRVLIPIHNSNSSNSSGSHTLSFWVGIYTQNVSTLSLWGSVSSTTAVTHSGTVGSYSLYSGGPRLFSIPWTTTLAPDRYWIANISRTTSGGANGTYNHFLISQANSNFLGHFGSSHNTTMQLTLGQGVYTATTSGLPNSVAFSEIRGSDSLGRRPPVVMFQNGTV